ncbi:MAG: leucine dehydrogenase [Simkaniaceae bacterium]|nr:leucine dehydrogenase [Simkaniaceae bacterium]
MVLETEDIDIFGYERVIRVTDPDTNLKAIIALHNTTLGPGLGGTRMYPYETFDDALEDVLRLSKGMTYKSGIVLSGTGGGKSVIIGDPKRDKTPELLASFAEAVNALEGRYICAEDVGIVPEDILTMLRTTKYVAGVPCFPGSGNPALYTGMGVFQAMRSACAALDGDPSLKGKRVVIQGVGYVGSRLVDLLFWEGADLMIADIDEERLRRYAHAYRARIVPVDRVHTIPCDIFSPCALGGVINEESVPELRCRAVVGSANNQLSKPSDADALRERGILYAPDFVANAGGLLNVVNELGAGGYRATRARDMTMAIYDQLSAIYAEAERRAISTDKVAVDIVDKRLLSGEGKRTEPLAFPFEELSAVLVR